MTAADRAATVVAVVIGGIIVMNAMLLSFVERYREFGVLRAIGWSRRRLVGLVFGEALALALAGAAAGVAMAYVATRFLGRLPQVRGILHAVYRGGVFTRALVTAFAVAVLGASYPASRAARLAPLQALRHE